MSSLPSVADWKKLLKTHPDAEETAPLTKAMDDYGKVAGKGEPAQLAALLEKVIDRAKAAKKKNPKNKELVGFIDDVIGDAQKELTRASKESEGEEDEGEAGDRLRAQLVRVKKLDPDQGRPFVLALGQIGGLVIARRPPITRDHRTTAKEMRKGKGKLLVGRCFGESGKYIFEFEDKPPGGLTKVIKKAVKTHTNMEIRIKVRGGGTELDDETDTAELTDFGEETETETEAEAATTPGPSVSPGAEAATATPKADPAAVFLQRARDLKALLDSLLAADPTAAAPIRTEYATALGHGQAKRYDTALPMIQDLDGRLRAALAKARAQTQTGPGASEWQSRLAAISPALKAALQAGGDGARELKTLFAEANDLAKKTEFGPAIQRLGQIQDRLDRSPAPVAGTREGPDPLEALRPQVKAVVSEWEQARAVASQGVEQLGSQLRGLGYPEANEAADVVDDLVEHFPDDLDSRFDALSAALDRGDDDAAFRLRDQARDDVKTCLQYLSANKALIDLIEDNDFGLKLKVREPLVNALKSILAGLK
jgi:hypothetical protein